MTDLSPRRTSRIPVAGGASFGISLFAGLILTMTGAFHVMVGLGALIGPSDNLWGTTDYSYKLDMTGWGWTHLVLGVIAVAVGVAIMVGRAWGFMAGLAVAFVSALGNFAFLPHQPFWSALMLLFDALVIWALTAELRDQA